MKCYATDLNKKIMILNSTVCACGVFVWKSDWHISYSISFWIPGIQVAISNSV